jgi:hypothetical protein
MTIRKSLRLLALATAPAAIAIAAPAHAAATIVTPCATATPTPTALACSGYFSGNLLDNSPTDQQNQIDALSAIGYTFNGNFNAIPANDIVSSLTSGMLSFGQTLYGITYIGIHFGDAGTGFGDRTVFYEFNFGTTGATGITLNTNGFSNGVLYATNGPVPEPATWAMMLFGFGAIGFALRRRGSLQAASA